MAYCDLDDLKNRMSEAYIIECTDDAGIGTVDTDKVDSAIADADHEIDFYCRKRYTVPFTTIPPIIKKLSVDIAIYNLYSRRRSVPDDRVTRYADAVTMLKAVVTGEGQIEGTEAGPDSSAIEVQPTFTKSKLDHEDEVLGRVMGRWDELEGSLDDW